jgi:hypothetical protein
MAPQLMIVPKPIIIKLTFMKRYLYPSLYAMVCQVCGGVKKENFLKSQFLY